MHKAVLFIVAAWMVALAPCATPPSETSRAPHARSQGNAASPEAPSQEVNGEANEDTPEEAEVEADVEAPPDGALTFLPDALHSPLGPFERAAMRAIAERAERDDHYFAKMGGSSVVSGAFLHCLARDEFLDLGGREDLRATLDYFREGRAQRTDPFRRQSIATHVGWSVRHVLTGSPHRALAEVQATRARYALILFGGNDVAARNPVDFGEKLELLMADLSAHGVIPVLGAATPRRGEIDHTTQRYNRLSRALARAWGIPYIDYYRANWGLPNHGLAGDGVHPNVFIEGRGRPCILTEEGLAHGHNQRNLRSLEALDRIRRAREGEPLDEAGEAGEARTLYGEGTLEAPRRIFVAPYGDHVELRELEAPPPAEEAPTEEAPTEEAPTEEAPTEVDGDAPAGDAAEARAIAQARADAHRALAHYACQDPRARRPRAWEGPELVYRVRVDEPTRVWAAAVGRRTDITLRHFAGPVSESAECTAGGQEMEIELTPGVHFFVVDTIPTTTRLHPDASVSFLLDTAALPHPE